MIIGAIVVVLLAVLLVWGVSSCNRETGGNGLINVGGSEASEESSGSESEEENIPGVADAPEEWLDEDYEDSSESSSSASGNNGGNGSSQSSSSENKGEESSSASSSSHVATIVPSNGNSGSSSSSRPSVEDVESDGEVTYEEYIAMSGTEQQKYLESFESIEAFFEWYNAAKEKYDKENPSIEIGDGSINMEDIIGGNP